jgi:hypothetical protein
MRIDSTGFEHIWLITEHPSLSGAGLLNKIRDYTNGMEIVK